MPSDDYLSYSQKGVISHQNDGKDSKPVASEIEDSNKFVVPREKVKRQYSDYLVLWIPIWQVENRGMNEEEGEAYKAEVERLKQSR